MENKSENEEKSMEQARWQRTHALIAIRAYQRGGRKEGAARRSVVTEVKRKL
jgi:hypothetical protein